MFDWKAPNPTNYAHLGADSGHFCLLAIIDPRNADCYDINHAWIGPSKPVLCAVITGDNAVDDADDWPGRFTVTAAGSTTPTLNPLIPGDLVKTVKNVNNVAWKNVTVGTIGTNDNVLGSVLVGGATGATQAQFRFSEPEEPVGPSTIFNWGSVIADLPPTLYTRWVNAGAVGTSVTILGNNSVRITANNAVLDNVPISPGERFTMSFRFEPFSGTASLPRRTSLDFYKFSLKQYAKRPTSTDMIGGNDFTIKTYRPAGFIIE